MTRAKESYFLDPSSEREHRKEKDWKCCLWSVSLLTFVKQVKEMVRVGET